LNKSVVFSRLAKARDAETRARLRQEIRRKVKRIGFAFHQAITSEDDMAVMVEFVNDVSRALGFCADGTVLTGDLDDPADWLVISGDRV
jgi:hypothetical protein